jgi:hypothetical protein
MALGTTLFHSGLVGFSSGKVVDCFKKKVLYLDLHILFRSRYSTYLRVLFFLNKVRELFAVGFP